MNILRTSQRLAATLACISLLYPVHSLHAQQPAAKAQAAVTILDVALAADGNLHGQLVNAQGAMIANRTVTVLSGNQRIATITTNADGKFSFGSLRGGIYQLVSGQTASVLRVWAPGTAPPSASSSVLLTTGGKLARGQGLPPLKTWLVNPYFMAGVVALAVGIPVLVHNANKDSGS
jgi:hypothetical protein